MILALGILIAVLATLYIAFPFYQEQNREISFELNHRAEDLEAQKMELYRAIKDVEFDHKMGKLSDDDFKALNTQYRTEAIDILKKIDALKPGVQVGDNAISFCHQCGQSAVPEDLYCSHCGAHLGAAEG